MTYTAGKSEKAAPKTYDTIVFDRRTSPFSAVSEEGFPQKVEQWITLFEEVSPWEILESYIKFRQLMKSEKTVEDYNVNQPLTKGKRKRKVDTGEAAPAKARKPKKTISLIFYDLRSILNDSYKAKKKSSKKVEEEEESELEDEDMEDYE